MALKIEEGVMRKRMQADSEVGKGKDTDCSLELQKE